MDSNEPEVDDLADLELSTFNPRMDLPADVDRHGDGWYDDKDDDGVRDDGGGWGNSSTDDANSYNHHHHHHFEHHPTTDPFAPTNTSSIDGSGGGSIIDEEFRHPIIGDSRANLNPFSDHVDDGDAVVAAVAFRTEHSRDSRNIDSPSSPRSYTGATSPSSYHHHHHHHHQHQSQLSPLNPFVARASTNPFANWGDETAAPSDYPDSTTPSMFDISTADTEYVYLSRLPEENLGMVLGIDGDQENRRPINNVHVKSITPGGAAARACQGNNRILVGDEIKEIDGKALNQLTHDQCIDLFQEMPYNVVLTISRNTSDTDTPDTQTLGDSSNPKRFKSSESEDVRYREEEDNYCDTRVEDIEGEAATSTPRGFNTPRNKDAAGVGVGDIPKGFYLVDATIIKADGQSLGVSIVPSYGATCDLYQIKRLVPDGACSQSECLEVGDRLLQCNGQNLKGLGQTQCLHVLKSSGRLVRLTLLRQGHKQQQTPVTYCPSSSTTSSFLPQPAGVSLVSENTGLSVSESDDGSTVPHSAVDEIETKDLSDTHLHDDDKVDNHHHIRDTELNSLKCHTEEIISVGNNNDDSSGVPLLKFDEDKINFNPFVVNSADCDTSGEVGDDSVFDSPKQRIDADESAGDETVVYSGAIPPPAQFSDSVYPFDDTVVENDNTNAGCVTNIDDLLSLDTTHQQHNYQTVHQEPPTANLLSFDTDDTQTHDNHDPFSIDNHNANPQSLEEFAELCFQNISDEYPTNSEDPIYFESSLSNYNQPTPDYTDIPVSTDFITLEESFGDSDCAQDSLFTNTTILPVSSEPDRFVSTISVIGKDSEPTSPAIESSYGSSQSPPYTTNINLKTSNQDNVSVIDITPTLQPSNKPSPPSPTPSPPPAYSGSVVFHTYAGSSPRSISSASILLDGDSTLQSSNMNGVREDTAVPAASQALVHSTIGVTTNGQEDEIITPMQAARNEQGKVFCVQKTDNSDSNRVKNLNDDDVKELAGVLDGFGNYRNGAQSESESSSHDVSEEEIVPIKMTREEKQSAMDVLSAWKGSDKKENKVNVLEEAVTRFSSSPLKSAADNGDDEEEVIKPMAVMKNSQGQKVIVPSSNKKSESEPFPQKNVTDLIDFLKDQSESNFKFLARSDSNDSGVDGHVSEEDIVPTIMTKKEAEIANNVVSLWGNSRSVDNSKPINATRPDSMGVTVTHGSRTDKEEGVITPMRHTKDPRGNSLWLPHDSNTTPSAQSTKQWDEGAVTDIADFLNASHRPTAHGESDSDREEIEEEQVSAQSLTRGEKDLASNVLGKWGSRSSDVKTVKDHSTKLPEDKAIDTQQISGTDFTDSKSEIKDSNVAVPDSNAKNSEQPPNDNSTVLRKPASQTDDVKKVLNKVNIFENKQNSTVVLRPKNIRNPSDFKARLAGFEQSSSSGTPMESSRARPKSMVDLPSNRKSWSAANSSFGSLSFKPLSSLRPLGSTLQRDDRSTKPTDRPSSGLSGSLFATKAPKAEHPKTRQEDGNPFQVDVLAGIVGLGLKVKASQSSEFPQVTDVQRNGPLGKSNNVKSGDYLLSVNGTDLSGQTDSRVQQILRLLPRGLVKLVLTTKPPSSSSDTPPTQPPPQPTPPTPPSSSSSSSSTPASDGTSKIKADNEPQTSSADLQSEGLHQPRRSTVSIKTLNGTETFLASTGEFDLTTSSTSKDNNNHVITEADFPDDVSNVSSASADNSNLAPVTARIEINPASRDGSPMKISIKPAPAPRPSSGVPTLSSTMSRNINYASSTTNESWDTPSSPDSTPRDPKTKRVSGHDLIANQRKPRGGDDEHDENLKSFSRSSLSSTSSDKDPEIQETFKPVVEELVQQSSRSAVQSAAPRALSPKVPPPVAPKPRLSTSSITSTKSDDSRISLDSPKSPPPVAPKTRTFSTNSDDSKEVPASSVKGPKVSAGYERLQAINKAKPTKPSRIIEKSRANVSSKAKMFESEAEDKEKQVTSPKPFNSSLLPMSERRKSTGSFTNQASSSLTRPKSLLAKGNLSKESSIPEVTSPTQESKDPASAKSPTRFNSALSPRRTSLAEPSASLAFTFAPKQAPKISQSSSYSSSTAAGKVTSPQKEDVVFHKTNSSSSLNNALSPSLPPSKLESRSKDTPLFKHGLSRRSNSEASLNMPNTLTLSSQVSEEKMEDTMKMFDDLLQDAPVTHTATDPADILLWAPVRKDRPIPAARSNETAKPQSASLLDSSTEVKRPLAPPRKSLSSLNKKDDDTSKSLSEKNEKPLSPENVIEEDLVVPESKTKDSNLPPLLLQKDNNQSNVSEELPVEEEVFVPETKPKDSHLPPSFLKTDERKTTVSEEPHVEEDVIVPESKSKDSHLPPAFLINEDNRDKVMVTARDSAKKEVVSDYEAMFRNRNETDHSQNIIANQLAGDILSERRKRQKQNYDSLLKNAMGESVNKEGNIPAKCIADSIQKDNTATLSERTLTNIEANPSENIPAGEIAKEILDNSSGGKDNHSFVRQENIPANEIAKDILNSNNSGINEQNVDDSSDVLLDIGGFKKSSNQPDSQMRKEKESNSETANNDRYVSQANEIVQTVITKISTQPELLFQEEKTFSPIEPASPESDDDDEPPPLPGAPPPPVIFRSNSEMLTDTAWLDNNVTKPNDEDIKMDKPSSIIEEDVIESVSEKPNNHALFTVNGPMENDREYTKLVSPRKVDLSNLVETNVGAVDMNLVSQNIAHVISKDLSGEEEELSHAKSDSSEPLNSTGESSFQEADAIRLHSPASVDVLSEDSGMPGDEEFQEVNTDDALSPINEFSRDNDIQETSSNVFTSKSPFYHTDRTVKHATQKPAPIQQEKVSLVNEVDESPSLPTSLPPPPPALPSLPPPNVPVMSDPIPSAFNSQSSNSPPLSKEVSTLGDQVTKLTDPEKDTHDAVVEEIVTVKQNISIQSVPRKDIESSNVVVSKEEDTNTKQRESRLIPSIAEEDEDKNKNDNSTDSLTVKSKRKWRLSSNSSVPSLVLEGSANSAVSVDYSSDTLKAALSPPDFVSLMTKANEVLDSLSASEDLGLFVIHIHRDGETKDLGIDLKSGSFYKVTKIKKDSPLAKEGSVMVDDWLIAMDNLWFPEVSLMRCLARLTKPKHNSLLVIARGQGSPLPSPTPRVEPRKERNTFSNFPERMEVKTERMEVKTVTKQESQPIPSLSKPTTSPPVSPRSNAQVEAKPAQTISPEVPKTPSVPVPEKTAIQQEASSADNAGGEGGLMNVMMMKGATGVGFCLEGGVGSPKGNVPIIIKRIFKGGPAEKCGQLKVKDEILSVNGVDFSSLRHYEAWNHLKFLDDGEVHFKIRRLPE